jgi:hypothetical protein
MLKRKNFVIRENPPKDGQVKFLFLTLLSNIFYTIIFIGRNKEQKLKEHLNVQLCDANHKRVKTDI